MAEIKIEKKKPIWPWIILIFIILIGIYFFWSNNDENLISDPLDKDTISSVEELFNVELLDNDSEVLYEGNYGTVRNEQAIADYLEFVDNNNHLAEESYYRSSFSKLIAATQRVAEIEGVDVSNNISAAKGNTDKISNATMESTIEQVSGAADEVSTALKRIQQNEFANLSAEMERVEKAASEIDGNQSLNSEQADIDMFLDSSAKILAKMHTNNNQQ